LRKYLWGKDLKGGSGTSNGLPSPRKSPTKISLDSRAYLVVLIFVLQIAICVLGQDSNLIFVLNGCAEYCHKLGNASLYFVCQEEVIERLYHLMQPDRDIVALPSLFLGHSYIYDYQLIRKGNEPEEQRTLIEEEGRKRNQKDASLATRFTHKHVIYGPVGLLGRENQSRFNFRIVDKKEDDEQFPVILEAIPKRLSDSDVLYGKIWIDDDFSILKIEWNQSSMGNFNELEKIAKQLNAKPQITFISEYDYKKQGIRFPSKYFVYEEYLTSRGKIRNSEIIVTYENYRFFVVETEAKIKKLGTRVALE